MECYLSPKFNGKLTKLDILSPNGTIQLNYPISDMNSFELFFRYTGPGYHFEAGIEKGMPYMIRNQYRLNGKTIGAKNGIPKIPLFFIWTPNKLEIYVRDNPSEPPDCKSVVTMVEPIPNHSVQSIKRSIFKNKPAYKSRVEFFKDVTMKMQSIQHQIDAHRLHDSFWNFTKEGKVPKREVDNHPLIEGLLSDFARANNMDLSHESGAGHGSLDLYLIAAIENVGLEKICIEVKNAHSPNLLHGLTRQLPEYMRLKESNYGIYIVLFFNGADCQGNGKDIHTLDFELGFQLTTLGINNIRWLILNLNRPPPPSKI